MDAIRRLTSASLLLSLLLLCVSCSSWQKSRALSDPAAREKHYSLFRVELFGGRVAVLRKPWFGGDTLYGRAAGKFRDGEDRYKTGDTVAFPLERIAKLEAYRFSASKTVLLVVGLGITAALIVAAANFDNGSGGGSAGSGDGSVGYSCPLVYSWDGASWWLDSGTYAGAIMPALARTDVDNLDHAVSGRDGIVRIRVTGAPGETEHVDAIRLLVVDHDPRCAVAPDAAGGLHSLGALREPVSARDFKRRDVLQLIRANDARSWESVPTGRDTTRDEDIRDGLEIEFPRTDGATEARLVVDGCYTAWADYLTGEYLKLRGRNTQAWYDGLAADPSRARAFAAAMAREVFLNVSIWDGARWKRQGFLPGAGPELSKRQVVRLDLSDVRGETVRVRLETAPLLWRIDRVAIDSGPERGFAVKEVGASEAHDSGGRDVRPELDRADGQVFVMEKEDSLDLRFAVDPAPTGQTRSYIAVTTGWYRIHTPESGEPDPVLAERLIREPLAMSRLSVARLNEALRAMRAESGSAER